MSYTKRSVALCLSLLFVPIQSSYLGRSAFLQARQAVSQNRQNLISVHSRSMVTGAEPLIIAAMPAAAPVVAAVAIATVPAITAVEVIATGEATTLKKICGFFDSVGRSIGRSLGGGVGKRELDALARIANEKAAAEALNNPILTAAPYVPTSSNSLSSITNHFASTGTAVGAGTATAAAGAKGAAVVKAAVTAKSAAATVTVAKTSIVFGGKGVATAATGKGLVLAKSTMVIGGGGAAGGGGATATTAAVAAKTTAPGWIPWVWAAAQAHPVIAATTAVGGTAVVGYGAYTWLFKAPVAPVTDSIVSLASSVGGGAPLGGGSSSGMPGGPKKPWWGSTVQSSSPMPDPDNDRIQRTDIDLYTALKEIKENYKYDKQTDSYRLKDGKKPIQDKVHSLRIDESHWEFEAHDVRGKHLGAIDPVTKQFYKPSVLGRKLSKAKK